MLSLLRVNLDFNFLDCQFVVSKFLENDPNSLITVSYPSLNILTYPSQWQIPIIFISYIWQYPLPLVTLGAASPGCCGSEAFSYHCQGSMENLYSGYPLPENTYLILCSSRNYPYPPSTEGTFALDPPSPGNFHPRGYVSYPPVPPGISVIFELCWVPSGKNICVKNVVALYCHAKDNFSAIK